MERDVPKERGAIRKEPGGRLGVALVYPNAWRLGMANLGVHAVYRLLNADPAVRCERAFLPEDGGEPRTIESGAPLRAFDAIAFSLSFEDDHPNVLRILSAAGLPLRAAARDARHPLVVAGGIAVQINPEPIAPFLDALLVGEGEVLVPALVATLREAREGGATREELLRALARRPGGYVPALHEVEYADTRAPGGRWVVARRARDGVPARVARAFLPDLRGVATSRAIDTPEAQFGDLYLTEVARGCLWGCRFCAAGFVQRPYREVDLATLRAEAREGTGRGQRVGLVGPDTSDHSGLDALTSEIAAAGGRFSPSSLRVDAIGPALARRLAEGGERTVTLAPEAGTERLRRVVNKDLSDDRIVRAAEDAIAAGMTGVKLYFMCGLPTETEEDVHGMAALALRIREEVMLPWARRRGRMGRMSLSVNPFVPKPWTPFQWDRGGVALRARGGPPDAPLPRRPPGGGPPRARARADRRRPPRRAPALAARPGLLRPPRGRARRGAPLGRGRPGRDEGVPGARVAARDRREAHPEVRACHLPGLRPRVRRAAGAPGLK